MVSSRKTFALTLVFLLSAIAGGGGEGELAGPPPHRACVGVAGAASAAGMMLGAVAEVPSSVFCATLCPEVLTATLWKVIN